MIDKTQTATIDDSPSRPVVATFAGGCFWCTEAIFKKIKGVKMVTSGYCGGWKEKPTYREVCNGQTGHAEAIQILFDPTVIKYETLLEIFFKLHDPTTLNKQGSDIGPQYRSAVFYHSQQQKETAQKVIKSLTNERYYKDPIITEITKFSTFYPAEDYHQNYFENNKNAPYCRVVIDPKIRKLLTEYPEAVI